MNRLRNRLILVFLVATLAPLAVTLWVTKSLLESSVGFASAEVGGLSGSLETTGREYYQRARAWLQSDAEAGRIEPRKYDPAAAEARKFWESGETASFSRSAGRLDYLVRRDGQVWIYSTPLGVDMTSLSQQIAHARSWKTLDFRRGFLYTYGLVAIAIWIVALGLMMFLASRISRPVQELTAGLSTLARGNPEVRVPVVRDDEIGLAMRAFNHMAGQLQQNRDRLVYLTQLASWQTLARKMAHEVKNSLTPIRLTVEEMLVRQGEKDSKAFMEQAAQIVVDEVDSLERRIRAFSEFAAEPPVRPSAISVNNLLEERVAFL